MCVRAVPSLIQLGDIQGDRPILKVRLRLLRLALQWAVGTGDEASDRAVLSGVHRLHPDSS